MIHRLTYLCVFVAVVVAGCDRPFVAIDPPQIEILSPDLSEVQLDDEIDLRLRITSLRRITRVEIDGDEAAAAQESDVFEFRASLSEGTNTLIVDAFDTDGDVGHDTLFAVHLPYNTANIAAATLPKALSDHSAILLVDGRLLVTGGFDSSDAPSAAAYTYTEQGFDFTITELPGQLANPRSGHTSSLLLDGRVLIVGGTVAREPDEVVDFITTGELFDPTNGEFSSLAFAGEPVHRAFHTATVLADDERTFVYLYGGRGTVNGSAVGTRSDVTVLEVRSNSEGDSLINVSPGGAVGAFPAVAHHVQLPLSEEEGFRRSFAAGTYESPDGGESNQVALRFLYSPSTVFFPFEVFEEPLPGMRMERIGHAAALALPHHVLISGGRTPEDAVLNDLEVFSDGARQFFNFPFSITLRTARHRHSATLLPSGRILLLGGISSAGTTLANAEYILPAIP